MPRPESRITESHSPSPTATWRIPTSPPGRVGIVQVQRRSEPQARGVNSNPLTTTEAPPAWQAGPFDHQRLDAYAVALEALVRGDAVARQLPRGYAKLADQLRRALLSAHLGVAEAASRTGADRRARFRCCRGEASEAAAALEAVLMLQLAPPERIQPLVHLLARLCAMLTRLAGITR